MIPTNGSAGSSGFAAVVRVWETFWPLRLTTKTTGSPTLCLRTSSTTCAGPVTLVPSILRILSAICSLPNAGVPSVRAATTVFAVSGIFSSISAAAVACCWESAISWTLRASMSSAETSSG